LLLHFHSFFSFFLAYINLKNITQNVTADMWFPLCHSYPSILRGNSSLPPEDRLLKFLVDNSADAEESVQCANCDQESSKKVRSDRLTNGSIHI